MWLSRLDLLAYGRFTKGRLDLGPGLHLIYGPNEAGKSTTLRAIRQLLFGVDERTDDNFVHPNADLRIGGQFCDENGNLLHVIRRKARKDSLRDANDDGVIDPERLQQLLCGVDEDTFTRRYGIDYEQLVAGGRELAAGRGDLGEILFAAGSGITDLTAIQKQLAAEAQELFRPNGKKQTINMALIEWQQQRDLIRDKLLPVAAWEEVDGHRQRIESQCEQVTTEWSRCNTERQQLQRLQQARSLIVEREALSEDLRRFESVAGLAPEFASWRQEASVVLRHVQEQERLADDAWQAAERLLQQLPRPTALLDHADHLKAVFADWTACEQQQAALQSLAAQHAKCLARMEVLREQLPSHSVNAAPDVIELRKQMRSRVQQLSLQHARCLQSQHDVTVRLEHANEQLARLPAIRDTAAPATLKELRRHVEQIRLDGDLEAQLARVESELSDLREELERQLAQFPLWSRPLSELWTVPIPATAVIEEFAVEFETVQAEALAFETRSRELADDSKRLALQIETFRRDYQVPTLTELKTSRAERDALWSRLREEISKPAPVSPETLAAFEESIQQVDQISDRLRDEADRVAQLAELLAEQDSADQRKIDIAERLAQIQTSRSVWDRRWSEAWCGLDRCPSTPREMQLWIVHRERILQVDSLVQRRQMEADQLRNRMLECCQVLSRLLGRGTRLDADSLVSRQRKTVHPQSQQVGGSVPHQQRSFEWGEQILASGIADTECQNGEPEQSLNELLEAAAELLRQDEAQQQARRDVEEQYARLTAERLESQTRLTELEAQWAAWRSAWTDAMTTARLPVTTSPETAGIEMDQLDELAQLQQRSADLEFERQQIEIRQSQLRQSVHELCQAVAPELSGGTFPEIVDELQQRWAEAQRSQAIYVEQTERQRAAEHQRAAVRLSRERLDELLSRIRDALQSNSIGTTQQDCEPAELLERCAVLEEQQSQRKLVAEKLGRVEEQLQNLVVEGTLDSLIERARSYRPEQLEQSLAVLNQQARELDEQRDRLNQQLGAIHQRLEQMDGRSEAAEAEENQQQCLAQIRASAEQFVRLKLASVALNIAIGRYRERVRGPMLKVASDCFEELTLGSFAGFRVDDDDPDHPTLVGIRRGIREPVTINGMSEGTCDQLYLALRLAMLQLESPPRSQLPFIVDDILIQFDDARSAAALRALSRLAERRQVIFFTHHEHLLEIAQQRLPGKFTAHRLTV